MINQNMQIQEFNHKLVEDKIDISIIEYVIELNEKFFNIDIHFIDDFMDLVDKDECCINYELLIKYGITSMIGGIGDIKKIIERNDGVEGTDFYLSQLAFRDDYSHKISYVLHPTFFKKILIRSRNTDKYADYYLLLEKCIYFYNQYEKLKLEEKINEINKFKVLKLEKSDTLENYIIVKDDRKKVFKYATIRGSTKNLKESLHELDLVDENIILRIILPHAVNFNKKIKEELKNNYRRQKVYALKDLEGKIIKKWKEEEDDEPAFLENEEYITTCNRWFCIKDMTEKDFIETICDINDSRFNN